MARKRKATSSTFRRGEKTVYKLLSCSNCETRKVRVDEDVVSVICAMCCVHYGPPINKPVDKKAKSNRPRGWKLYGVYVDKDGNVFHKGEEQAKLKGTLPKTLVKAPVKLSKVDRERKKLETLQKKEVAYKKKQEKLKGG